MNLSVSTIFHFTRTAMMSDIKIIFLWLKEHVWLCTYIMLGLAVLTFLLNFIFKKNNSEKTQSIGKVKNSNINQAGGDIKIHK